MKLHRRQPQHIFNWFLQKNGNARWFRKGCLKSHQYRTLSIAKLLHSMCNGCWPVLKTSLKHISLRKCIDISCDKPCNSLLVQYAMQSASNMHSILLVSTILNSWTHNFQATIIPTFWEFLACGNLVWSLVEFFWADLKLYPTKGCAICLDHSIYHATEWADWTSGIIRPVTYYKTKHWVPKILSNLNCELG